MRNLLRITGIALLGLGITCIGHPFDAVAQECSASYGGCLPTYGYDYSRDNVNPNETYFKASTLGTHVIPSSTNSPDPDNKGLASYPGSSPVVTWNSSSGGLNTDAVLWILVTSGYTKGPAKLYAYTALPGVGGRFTQLWSDATNGPWATKFMVPTVINGHVYVGGQKPNASCSAGACLGRVVAWR